MTTSVEDLLAVKLHITKVGGVEVLTKAIQDVESLIDEVGSIDKIRECIELLEELGK